MIFNISVSTLICPLKFQIYNYKLTSMTNRLLKFSMSNLLMISLHLLFLLSFLSHVNFVSSCCSTGILHSLIFHAYISSSAAQEYTQAAISSLPCAVNIHIQSTISSGLCNCTTFVQVLCFYSGRFLGLLNGDAAEVHMIMLSLGFNPLWKDGIP